MWNKGDWGISLSLFLPPSSTPSLLKILRLQRKNRALVPHVPQTSFPFYFLESKNCRERIWRKFRKRAGFQNHVLFHWLEVVSVYSSVKLCSFYNQKHFKLYGYINSHPVTQQGASNREISLRKNRAPGHVLTPFWWCRPGQSVPTFPWARWLGGFMVCRSPEPHEAGSSSRSHLKATAATSGFLCFQMPDVQSCESHLDLWKAQCSRLLQKQAPIQQDEISMLCGNRSLMAVYLPCLITRLQ